MCICRLFRLTETLLRLFPFDYRMSIMKDVLMVVVVMMMIAFNSWPLASSLR